MATTLSEEQRSRVRFYLGYPDNYREMNSALESLLTVGLSAGAETLVLETLTQLILVDAGLVDARKRLKALKVGSITLTLFEEIRSLRREGARFASRLASLYSVDINRDVFSDGDSGMSGGVIPIG